MKFLIPIFALVFFATAPAAAKEKSIAATEDTAVFLPIAADWGVDFYVEKVDGKATKFGAYDSVVVDAGNRTLDIRLEYKPASGSSVLVGGLANLLLRATTNKTFRTTMEVDVEGGNQYQLSAIAEGDQLEILAINHSDETIVQSQTFKLKDGKFERTF